MRTQYTLSGKDVERFWSKINQPGDPDSCWEWQGRRSDFGHGQFDIDRGASNVPAHRLMWFIANGRIPDDHEICHECDNPPCCNPLHLFAGTHTENIQDMWNKGRGNPTGPIGERAPQSILTEATVMEVRQRYVDTDYPLWRMANEYGITRKGLVLAIKGKNWAHLPQPEPTVSPEEAERIRQVRAYNERPIRSKLSEDQVREIRRLFDNGMETRAELARRFGITYTTADNIVHRRIWKNITDS